MNKICIIGASDNDKAYITSLLLNKEPNVEIVFVSDEDPMPSGCKSYISGNTFKPMMIHSLPRVDTTYYDKFVNRKGKDSWKSPYKFHR